MTLKKNLKELKMYVSPCCKAQCSELEDVIISSDEPGVTSYYRNRCDKCLKPCHLQLDRMFDSDGIEIKHGDLVECTSEPIDCAWRWHAACKSHEYGLEVRDLGHNNIGMLSSPFYCRGPYWRHLDKLSDEDLEYYWGTNRRDADALLKGLEK